MMAGLPFLLALLAIVAVSAAVSRVGNEASVLGLSIRESATLTDHTARLTVDDIARGAGGLFEPDIRQAPHFGIGAGVHWLRLRIAHDRAGPETGILVIRFPYLEDVTLFAAAGSDGWSASRVGSMLPMERRTVPSNVPAFRLTIPPGEGTEVYLRVQSSTVVMTPLEIMTPAAFWRRNGMDQAAFGVMVGILLACAFYVLTFYIALRDESFLAFSVFAAAAAFYVMLATGLAKLWLWPEAAGWTTPLYYAVQGVLFSTAAWFFKAYLRTAHSAPATHLLLRLMVWCGALSIVAPLLPMPVASVVYLLVGLGGPLVLLGILLNLWRCGHPQARIAAIGWSGTLIITVHLYLRVFDITPYLAINGYLAPSGFAFAVIYFAWALAWRLRETETRALHDPMTGMPNRRYLDIALASHARRCAGRPAGIAVLHIDLDGFKQINDMLGHEAGDKVLVRTARLLRANIRKPDFIARIGGDEFIVVCPYQGDSSGLSAFADRLIKTIGQPFSHDGHPCRIGASIGIAHAMGDDVDGARLIGNADIALYAAKALGRGRYEFFTPAQSVAFEARRKTADDIIQALGNREFTCVYQPVFESRGLTIAGVEALLRWRHPARGLLAPADFLRQAGELGMMGAIDKFVLEHASAAMQGLRDEGISIPSLSVNVSTRRLHDPALIHSLQALNISRGQLAFELLETTSLQDLDATAQGNIAALKELGIALDIDDFGTGHAAILSVMEIAPRRVKIDRALIAPLGRRPDQTRLIKAIIEMGRALGAAVVAEGVETAEQTAILRELGCDYLQGYHLAHPMQLDELRAFMKSRVGMSRLAIGAALPRAS